MAFNLPHFLRRTAPAILADYFRFRLVALPETLDWSMHGRTLVERLHAIIVALEERHREMVYQDFENAGLLADETGQLALRSVLAGRPDIIGRLDSLESGEARSLATLLHDESSLRKALAARLADRLRTGRSWSGFVISSGGLPVGDGPPSASDIAAFDDDLRRIFRKLDGSGRNTSIDRFQREAPGASHRITQYTVFVEGLPQASNEFEAEVLVPRPRSPVFETAVCHDAVRGTIDVVCKGGRRVRLEVAKAFVHRILGFDGALDGVTLRSVALDDLKSRMSFASDPIDGIRRVAVTRLRLSDAGTEFGRITLEVSGRSEEDDIWTRSAGWFTDADPLSDPGWSVANAGLRFEFHPDAAGGPGKVLNVDLQLPHGTNLKDLPRRHAGVVEKYLQQWGLLRNDTI